MHSVWPGHRATQLRCLWICAHMCFTHAQPHIFHLSPAIRTSRVYIQNAIFRTALLYFFSTDVNVVVVMGKRALFASRLGNGGLREATEPIRAYIFHVHIFIYIL